MIFLLKNILIQGVVMLVGGCIRECVCTRILSQSFTHFLLALVKEIKSTEKFKKNCALWSHWLKLSKDELGELEI